MKTQTFDEIVSKIYDDEIQMHIYHEVKPYYDGHKWEVRLYKTAEGITIDVESKSIDFFEAFYDCWTKYQRIVNAAIPEMVPQQLEYHADA